MFLRPAASLQDESHQQRTTSSPGICSGHAFSLFPKNWPWDNEVGLTMTGTADWGPMGNLHDAGHALNSPGIPSTELLPFL